MLINISGLRLDIDATYVESTPSTKHANGYSELEWSCTNATDEIGENISTNALDLICNEYQSEIERAIWAQIEGKRS
jgi:hypothetical protein